MVFFFGGGAAVVGLFVGGLCWGGDGCYGFLLWGMRRLWWFSFLVEGAVVMVELRTENSLCSSC